MGGIPMTGRDRPIEGQRHDEDQAVEAIGVANLGILDAEPAGFEVGEHRLDAPAPAVIQGRKVPRLVGHGDDPRFGVTGIMDNPDMGPGAPGGEFDIFEVEAFAAGTGLGGCPGVAVEDRQIAFEAQAITPATVLTPTDQIGGAIEAVPHQHDLGAGRYPRHNCLQQGFLGVEPDRSLGRLHPPRHGQSPLAVTQRHH